MCSKDRVLSLSFCPLSLLMAKEQAMLLMLVSSTAVLLNSLRLKKG
ncbi:MAG: hypothetical protein GY762_23065 [Proteobacteria bacterium]|nr:hypothetical protein [Pseudomonadota bacterium]